MYLYVYVQARLRDKHQELLRKKLFFLKQQQLAQEEGDVEDSPLFPGGSKEEEEEDEKEEVGEKVKSKTEGAGPSGADDNTVTDVLIDEEELLRGALEAYVTKGYSPRLIKHGDVDEVCGGGGWMDGWREKGWSYNGFPR